MRKPDHSLSAFAVRLREEEKSENTVSKYVRDAGEYLAFLKGGAVTKKSVIAFKNHLLSQGYAQRSINSMLCSVNAYLHFCGRDKCRVKVLKIQRKVFCDESKELSKEEYKRLCAAAERTGNVRLSLLLQTLCGTGIRVGELKFITVEAAVRGEATVTLKGKTRTVFFVPQLRKKLLRYAKERGICSGEIFRTKSGRSMSRTNIWKEMKTLCAAANVDPKKVFPHNLRHLFARVFYAVRKNLAQLADVLGHSSVETTRIYLVSSGKEHYQTLLKMGLVT